jgi:hypothetical protein
MPLRDCIAMSKLLLTLLVLLGLFCGGCGSAPKHPPQNVVGRAKLRWGEWWRAAPVCQFRRLVCAAIAPLAVRRSVP